MDGGGRVSFKAVALNLEGGFKDVALNGVLMGGWWGVVFKGLALNGGGRRAWFQGCSLESGRWFQGCSLEWGVGGGVVFKGLALNGGAGGVGFKAVALNLEGGFKDVALNGGLVGGCFQGFSLEWIGWEKLVSRLEP